MNNMNVNGAGNIPAPTEIEPVAPSVTPNLNLPLARPMSKPTWLGTFNGAMSIIDNQVSGIESGIRDFAQTVQNQLTDLNDLYTNLGSVVTQNTETIIEIGTNVTDIEKVIRKTAYEHIIPDVTKQVDGNIVSFHVSLDGDNLPPGYYFFNVGGMSGMSSEQTILQFISFFNGVSYQDCRVCPIGVDLYGRTTYYSPITYLANPGDFMKIYLKSNSVTPNFYLCSLEKIVGV